MHHSLSVKVSCVVLVLRSVECIGHRCSSAWFRDPTRGVRDIPEEWIDDGYCDCPLDGSDEPTTGACAGSMDGGWAGLAPREERSHFQCPQQKTLMLPLSRLNDGICDCCDGVDEPSSSSCPDICDEVLAEERAARAKAEAEFSVGFERRQQGMESFQKLLKETVSQIEFITKVDLPALDKEIGTVDDELKKLRLDYMNERLGMVQSIGKSVAVHDETCVDDSVLTGLLEPLSLDEIYTFIAYTCQLCGEMDDSKSASSWKNGKTCIPLRLAGIDMGFLWENENTSECTASFRRIKDGSEEDLMEIAILMDKNSGDEGDWSIGADNGASEKKKYDYDIYDDDEIEDYDDYDHEFHHDDELMDDDEHDEREESRRRERKAEEARRRRRVDDSAPTNSDVPKIESLRGEVESTLLSFSRAPFRKKASALMSTIDELMKSSESDNDEEETSEEDGEMDENAPMNVDPMAIQMVSGSLSKRTSNIERGIDYAISAKILLDELEEAGEADMEKVRRDLIGLAVGTMYHGNISAQDVAEILYLILPEVHPEAEVPNADQGSCPTTKKYMCPPTTVTRQEGGRSFPPFPPAPIVAAAETRCKLIDDSAGDCEEDEDDIPASIPDGYYNYYAVQPRDSSDVLTGAFSSLDKLWPVRSLTSVLEKRKSDLEAKHKEMDDEVSELEERIGGKEEAKFGTDGELHSLRDTCHAVEAGKYEYEVCIFGKATQRDRGTKGGGTNLGQWKGMELDEESGGRILSWDKGTKCWNGPQRSATVHVTCGAETKMLTADEPDTCRYVFTMESHIACDEAVGKRYGLL